MQDNDLEELIARFISAIEIAETTAKTLQSATAPLVRISARIEELAPETQEVAQLEVLVNRLPSLTAELTSGAVHLRNSLRPPVFRIWLTASTLVLSTILAVLLGITTLRPHWCLTEPLANQLRIGRLLEENLSLLSADRQRVLSSILQELTSSLRSSHSSTAPSETPGLRSEPGRHPAP